MELCGSDHTGRCDCRSDLTFHLFINIWYLTMKLSKDSLWNRFLYWHTDGNLPSDVCSYVSTSTLAVSILGISCLFLAGFFLLPYHIYLGTELDDMSLFIKLLIFMGSGAWTTVLALILVIVIYAYSNFVHPVFQKTGPNKTESDEPSVISQWIEDKKEKVCTRIEYD